MVYCFCKFGRLFQVLFFSESVTFSKRELIVCVFVLFPVSLCLCLACLWLVPLSFSLQFLSFSVALILATELTVILASPPFLPGHFDKNDSS
jgi:hypothetical protein